MIEVCKWGISPTKTAKIGVKLGFRQIFIRIQWDTSWWFITTIESIGEQFSQLHTFYPVVPCQWTFGTCWIDLRCMLSGNILDCILGLSDKPTEGLTTLVCGETNDKQCCCFFGDAQQTSVRITSGTPSCRGHIPQWHWTPSCKHNCTIASSRSSSPVSLCGLLPEDFLYRVLAASRLTHLHSACAFQPQPQPAGHSADSSLAGLSRENVSSDHFEIFGPAKAFDGLGSNKKQIWRRRRPESSHSSHSHGKRAADAWRYWALRHVGPKIASRANSIGRYDSVRPWFPLQSSLCGGERRKCWSIGRPRKLQGSSPLRRKAGWAQSRHAKLQRRPKIQDRLPAIGIQSFSFGGLW